MSASLSVLHRQAVSVQTLRLPVPPSANNLYINRIGGKGRYRSPEYKAWQDEAGNELVIQRAGYVAGKVSITYACPRNGRRDLSNHEKGLTDLLVEHGVIDDDRHVERLLMHWHDGDNVVATIEAVQQ